MTFHEIVIDLEIYYGSYQEYATVDKTALEKTAVQIKPHFQKELETGDFGNGFSNVCMYIFVIMSK